MADVFQRRYFTAVLCCALIVTASGTVGAAGVVGSCSAAAVGAPGAAVVGAPGAATASATAPDRVKRGHAGLSLEAGKAPRGTGKRLSRWPARDIRLHVRCEAVDTLVVNIECPESGPRALNLKRIRCKRSPSDPAVTDTSRRAQQGPAVREVSHRPWRRTAVIRTLISGAVRLVIAIIGVVFF